MSAGFRIIPHTSEVGLELSAWDWASFYRTAADGLLALYGLKPGRQGTSKVSRSFAADTPEDLLVAWLTELIFLIGTEKLVPARIDVLKAGAQTLRVEIFADLRAPGGPAPQREIKAVTYHGLKVAATPEGLRARIILDV